MSENCETSTNEQEQLAKVGQIFNSLISQTYGHLRAPDPYITPTGISHLDALLGGGIVSSGPVMISSTPETGKSTFAYQFSSVFQHCYPTSGIVLYIDIETAGSTKDNKYNVSRIKTFGLQEGVGVFQYEPLILNVNEVFELIKKIVDMKKTVEEKTGREFKVLVIWDSIASTRSSKTDAAEDHNKTIGFKAREVSFNLDKYTPHLKFNKITFITIDQIRADIKIDGPYTQEEKTVGSFKNVKSATNIFSLQHNVQQWLFLSKKKEITYADGMGVDGWYIDIFTEKNKLTKSKHAVTCVFDKNRGIDKFWSEFHFMSNVTPSEHKIYKKKAPPFKFFIKQKGAYYYLSVTDPNNPSISYKSDTFYKKDAKSKYETDSEFKKWFDYAVILSTEIRIINGILNQDVALDTPISGSNNLDSSNDDLRQFTNSLDVDVDNTNDNDNDNDDQYINNTNDECIPENIDEGDDGYQRVFT